LKNSRVHYEMLKRRVKPIENVFEGCF